MNNPLNKDTLRHAACPDCSGQLDRWIKPNGVRFCPDCKLPWSYLGDDVFPRTGALCSTCHQFAVDVADETCSNCGPVAFVIHRDHLSRAFVAAVKRTEFHEAPLFDPDEGIPF